ncbi:MAG: sigma-70 family RNA polymerase sigma factor [Candidatus Eisenbacteria bacterium]
MARRWEDLADGIRSRDPEAVRDLFRTHHGMVFRFVRRECGSRDEAEELTARVFFRVIDSAFEFRGTTAMLPAYLFGVARNVIRENRRDVARWIPMEDAVTSVQPAAHDLVQVEDEWSRLREAVACLRPEEQEVLHLRFVEGFPLARVASAMGLPVGTVKSHIHRLRVKLRGVREPQREAT